MRVIDSFRLGLGWNKAGTGMNEVRRKVGIEQYYRGKANLAVGEQLLEK